ncbi:hypothetical protein PEDI_20630 [Persicobacter diffluens]|uniref:Uncharacterized protein n=1 Tax=Persicobacter diffluens TaxID=981 RepID=A0AAN5ALJ9_9BACT|nr:hypothetical protein PEDI_20630 [Persicobacter diffluens]
MTVPTTPYKAAELTEWSWSRDRNHEFSHGKVKLFHLF